MWLLIVRKVEFCAVTLRLRLSIAGLVCARKSFDLSLK